MLAAAALSPWLSCAFTTKVTERTSRQRKISFDFHSRETAVYASTSSPEDCGCDDAVVPTITTYSGKPGSEALEIPDLRAAIQSPLIFNVNGERLRIDDVIGAPDDDLVSVVVFLRSLG